MTAKDRIILRDLAKRVREVAEGERMAELRKKWIRHNDFETSEPMVLFETGGMVCEAAPDALLECESDDARAAERVLRLRLFQAESIRDDTVIDADFRVNWDVKQDGWRKRAHNRHGDVGDEHQAGYVPIPVLTDPKQIVDMPYTTYSVDREGTARTLAFWENVFGDLLSVRLRGTYWWTLGLTWDFLRLTGLEAFLTMPYDDPKSFSDIMKFLENDALGFVKFLEAEDLFTLNNANDYVGSGTLGYTSLLPGEDFAGHVKAKHLWCLVESQESVVMSPKMFAEFIFPHQNRVAQAFGLSYYGCCEPIDQRFDTISKIENLHTVSVSAWCNMRRMAAQIDRPLVWAAKPNPALVSSLFEEEALRGHCKEALECFGGEPMELVMKDVHTVNGDLSRCGRWVELAREEINRAL